MAIPNNVNEIETFILVPQNHSEMLIELCVPLAAPGWFSVLRSCFDTFCVRHMDCQLGNHSNKAYSCNGAFPF